MTDNVSGWKVLIVDDDQDNLSVAADYLQFLGAEVRTGCDGVVGLECLSDFTPTIILLDLSMPNMDGWEMFKQLRADPATTDVPVIALTAHAMPQDKERVIQAGFDGYITKPFILSTLLDEMKYWLGEAAKSK